MCVFDIIAERILLRYYCRTQFIRAQHIQSTTMPYNMEKLVVTFRVCFYARDFTMMCLRHACQYVCVDNA